MRYISTSRQSVTDLRGAIMHCMAPDGSIYLPESLPVIPKAYFNNIQEMTLQEIAYVVVATLFGTDTTNLPMLKKIVDLTFSFSIPLQKLDASTEVLELFHGPTMAFKDVGARFLAEFVDAFHKSNSRRPVGLVATTGNTGAAIANAFGKHRDRHVVILFPRGGMSRQQLAQFTTVGENIHPIEVGGSIADCKRMIREAMHDQELADKLMPVWVNTNNFLRIVPQVAFSFYAYAQMKKRYGREADGMTIAVPCGCLSNLTAVVIAKKMGLPIGRIVGGCNANDDFVRVLEGQLAPDRLHVNSRPTLAYAMDSGAPTNLPRLIQLYGNSIETMRRDIEAISINDEEIAETVNGCVARNGYLPDPHTAVALGALMRSEASGEGRSVVFATAHPAKSLDIMTAITGRAIELPLQLTRFMAKGTKPRMMAPSFPALKKLLLSI